MNDDFVDLYKLLEPSCLRRNELELVEKIPPFCMREQVVEVILFSAHYHVEADMQNKPFCFVIVSHISRTLVTGLIHFLIKLQFAST